MDVRDQFGVEIEEGSYILYPMMWANSCYIKVGKVLSVNDTGRKDWKNKKVYTLTVIGAEKQYSEKFRATKKATLQNWERVVVIDPENIPEDVYFLLK